MGAQRKSSAENKIVELASKNKRKSRPASNPESREQQLINLAVDLAEKQLMDGTAAPSVINHYLKLGTTRERLERDILEKQSKLIDAKADSLTKEKESEQLTKDAIEAMKNYNSGN